MKVVTPPLVGGIGPTSMTLVYGCAFTQDDALVSVLGGHGLKVAGRHHRLTVPMRAGRS